MKNKTRLLTCFLVLSAGFNVFFILGYVKTSRVLVQLRTPEGRVQLISDRLGLEQDQREQLAALMTELRSRQAEIKQANQAANDDFWYEIMKDEPDMQKVATLVAKSSQPLEASRQLGAEYLQEIMKVLDAGQRQALARMIREKDYTLH